MTVSGVRGGQLEFLTSEQVRKVHITSLRVLENVGARFDDEEARDLLAKSGAEVDSKKVVRLPGYLVEEMIRKAPKLVTLCSRTGRFDVRLYDREVFNGAGAGGMSIVEPSGERRPATVKDLADLTRLQDSFENVHMISTPVTLMSDYQLKGVFKKCYQVVTENSEKHVINNVESRKDARDQIRMASLVAGDSDALRKKPLLSMVADMAAPLHYGTDTAQIIMECARARVPVFIESDPQAGGTAPINLAGLLVQQNAEILAGITLAQLAEPGAPVVYYHAPGNLDQRTGSASLGCPERSIYFIANAQLARYYGLPISCVAGTTDSKIVDIQSGYEKAISIFAAAVAGYNIMTSHIGTLEAVTTISYEQSVIDNEIYGMVYRILRGSEISENTLNEAFDVISKVGPLGRHYLAQDHTRKYLPEVWLNVVSDRRNWGIWSKTGKKGALEHATEMVAKILSEHRPEPIPEGIRNQLSEIVKESV
jgi:trimethylamine--corrinoid protein Co-methyltransferase